MEFDLMCAIPNDRPDLQKKAQGVMDAFKRKAITYEQAVKELKNIEDEQRKVWYILEKRKSNQGSIIFWRDDNRGYCANKKFAGLYTREEALKNEYKGETFAVHKDIIQQQEHMEIVFGNAEFLRDDPKNKAKLRGIQ